jgi:hypothetical protein
MRIVALMLVIVAGHFGWRGAVILGSSLQDQEQLGNGPEGLMYLLLAGALLMAASIVHRLQLFTTVPSRSANVHDHAHHAASSAEAPAEPAFSGIHMPTPRNAKPGDESNGSPAPAKPSPGRTFLIDFNIDQIRSRWEAQNRTATDEEVRVWLISLGYIPTPDGWLGDEDNLDQFDRSEILRCRSIARTNNQLEESRRRQIEQTMRQMKQT